MARRLLVVTQHFWPESFRINDIVQGMIADGIQVDVLCGLPNYPKGEWFDGYRYTGPRREEWNGAQVFRAGEVRRKGNTSLRIFLNYVSWPFLALFNLWRLPGGYDGILCYNTSPVLMSFPALVYGKLHRIPVTNYVLDIWPENLYSVLPVKSRFWQTIATAVSDWHYRAADRLIAMSDGLRDKLLTRTGKAEQDVAVIPQYCEDFYAVPGPCEDLKQQFAGRFNLVFTGNFSPAQALPTVIRAAGRARALGAEHLHLLLVGDGMSRPELETLVKNEGLEDLVTFWGSVPPEKVPRFTALADGLVASLNDSPDLGLTVPAKIASYMAAAKPLLASMDGEGAAAVSMSGGGLASPACDEAALAENMLRLYRMEPAARQRMGRAAYAWYESHYTRAVLLAQLERFILE